jgi:SAM-dependent methyltransferase
LETKRAQNGAISNFPRARFWRGQRSTTTGRDLLTNLSPWRAEGKRRSPRSRNPQVPLLAQSRLSDLSESVEWVLSDFRTIPAELMAPDTFDVVISSYALHHLDAEEKLAVLKSVVRAIRPGGCS